MWWLNEPAQWSLRDGVLDVAAERGTDFWRVTGYGFIRDGGHVYGRTIQGDTDISVRLRGQFRHQYDQAGLMLYVDESTWIKAGVEYVDGRLHLSTVVTRDFSDWSMTEAPDGVEDVWLRLTRRAEAVEVHFSADGEDYRQLRLGYLPPDRAALAGVMCAAPEGEGFAVSFHGLTVAGS